MWSCPVYSRTWPALLQRPASLQSIVAAESNSTLPFLLPAAPNGETFYVQISEKERDVELSSLFKDVASIIAEKCINPKTQRPYTITMIERALRDCHFSVDPKRSAKQQALQARPRGYRSYECGCPLCRTAARAMLTLQAGCLSVICLIQRILIQDIQMVALLLKHLCPLACPCLDIQMKVVVKHGCQAPGHLSRLSHRRV